MAWRVRTIIVNRITSDPASEYDPPLLDVGTKAIIEYAIMDDASGATKANRLQLNDIDESMTMADWWNSVVQQVRSAEGLT